MTSRFCSTRSSSSSRAAIRSRTRRRSISSLVSPGPRAPTEPDEDALASNKRYSACFTLPKLNAYHLGELLYMLAMSVAYEGELSNVDAFNQPGVEAYKRIMGPKLAEVKAANQNK